MIEPQREARRITLHVVAATVLALVLRLFHLGSQSLWIDEVFTYVSAAIGKPFGRSELLENVHGPLFSALLHAWGGLAGTSEWSLRFPAAIFGVLTVPALAWLAVRWLGRETAPAAAWLAAASPFLVWYGQESRNYTLLVLATCLAGVAALAFARSPSLRHTVALAGATLLGLLSNFSFALFLPVLFLWAVNGREGRRPRMARLGLAVAVALVALTPWVPQLARTWDWRRLLPGAEQGPSLRGTTTLHAGAAPFALHAFAVGYTLGPPLRELRGTSASATLTRHARELAAVAVVFGALLVLGLRALAHRRRLGVALVWLLLPALVVTWFASGNFKVFHPRYLAVSVPAFLLVLAAAIGGMRPRARALAALAVAALWAASLVQLYGSTAYAKEDYRGALTHVNAHAGPGEGVLAVGAEDPLTEYYRGPLPVDRLWLGFADRPKVLEEKLAQALARRPGTWVVLSRPEDLDPHGEFARLLDRLHPEAERWRSSGIRVWHVRRDVASPAAAGEARR